MLFSLRAPGRRTHFWLHDELELKPGDAIQGLKLKDDAKKTIIFTGLKAEEATKQFKHKPKTTNTGWIHF